MKTRSKSAAFRKRVIFGLIGSSLILILGITPFLKTRAFDFGQPQNEKNINDEISEARGTSEVSLLKVENPPDSKALSGGAVAPVGSNSLRESDSGNDTPATAQRIYTDFAKIRGNIAPNADLDYYSFYVNANDKLFLAVNPTFTGSTTSNSVLDVFDSDGTTLIENDDDDGSLGGSASSIAGLRFATGGIKYFRVKHFSATSQIRPYDVYFRLVSGSPTAEIEPNDTEATATPLPANGFASGAISSAVDTADYYSLNLNAGDTVFLSLDADPERDGITWNPRLGLGNFNNFILVINDANIVSPNSEAFYMTVKNSGTYYVLVDPAVAGSVPAGATYQLSATVIPAERKRCTTYNSTNVPQPIGPDPTSPNAVSTINIADSKRIGNLQVALNIDHTKMDDLDLSLKAPDGNEVTLFNDIGSATANTAGLTQMDTVFDDEAALVPNFFTVMKDMNYQPEGIFRLGWFRGQQAQGTWTLTIRDDTAANAGTLNNWGLTVCEEPSPANTPASLTETIYNNNFEANDGGFTHSGTGDVWERGLPVVGTSTGTITSCNSGVNCWKTKLDATYSNNADFSLVSPPIDLTARRGQQLTLAWAQKYQLESVSFDQVTAEIREVGGSGAARTLWAWNDPTMTGLVGSPVLTIQSAAGWRNFEFDVSEFAGKTVQVTWRLVTDSSNTSPFAGVAVDDVKVTASKLAPFADFNGNGGTDLSVFRNNAFNPNEGAWYAVDVPTNSVVVQEFGLNTDILVPADYNGDGKTDIATFRPSEGAWYVSNGSRFNFVRFLWGTAGDVPVQGDYDGDGKADYAVFRPTTGVWWIRRSSDGATQAFTWGIAGDKAVPADYDGDGKTDLAVFRNGTWYVQESATGKVNILKWGISGDKAIPADFDGDRKADFAVWRATEGRWYLLLSGDESQKIVQFGLTADTPVVGDYDRDRKADIAVWRNGIWYILRSSDGAVVGYNWGLATDKPVPPSHLPQ